MGNSFQSTSIKVTAMWRNIFRKKTANESEVDSLQQESPKTGVSNESGLPQKPTVISHNPKQPFRYELIWDNISSIGDMITGCMETQRYGKLVFRLSKNNIQGNVVAQFPNYHLGLHRWIDGMSEISEMATDLQNLVKVYEETGSRRKAISRIVGKHIDEKHRIVDDDMSTYICYLILILNAIRRSLSQPLMDLNEKKEIYELCLREIEKNYSQYIVMTGFTQTPYGIQPYPIPYRQYLSQKRLTSIPL